MNWELKEGRLRSESKIHRAQIVRDHQPGAPGYILDLQIGCHPRLDFKTSYEAEKWAEARMSEFKNEFILSLITNVREDEYSFGGLLRIIQVQDIWRVESESDYLFTGTLEECKNYIVELWK